MFGMEPLWRRQRQYGSKLYPLHASGSPFGALYYLVRATVTRRGISTGEVVSGRFKSSLGHTLVRPIWANNRSGRRPEPRGRADRIRDRGRGRGRHARGRLSITRSRRLTQRLLAIPRAGVV